MFYCKGYWYIMAVLVWHFANQFDEDNNPQQVLTFYHVKCGSQAFIEASLKHQEGGHDIYLIDPYTTWKWDDNNHF